MTVSHKHNILAAVQCYANTLKRCGEGRLASESWENLLKVVDTALSSRLWQPISTAPKNNDRLLYLARFNQDGELVELDFDGIWEYWQESWEMAHINGYAWFSNDGIEEPTHWAYQDDVPPLIPPNTSENKQ